MTKPANTVLSFPSRVQLVQAEINKRVSDAKTQRDALRARLWCRWLNREVLS